MVIFCQAYCDVLLAHVNLWCTCLSMLAHYLPHLLVSICFLFPLYGAHNWTDADNGRTSHWKNIGIS